MAKKQNYIIGSNIITDFRVTELYLLFKKEVAHGRTFFRYQQKA